jgi:glycosyltransferase involved in cell wall biosynthesis
MRIHVLGLPHTQTHRDFTACAFTQKVYKFLKMMSGHGHEIFHYGHERIDWEYPDVTHVPVIDTITISQAYGNEYVYQQTWRELGFAHYYRVNDHAHTTFSANTIKELNKRKQPNDLVLHFWGATKPVADALPDMIHIEPGLGNGSGWARWRVYESYTLRAACEGINAVNYCNQDWYHSTIYNYFDPADFTYNDNKEDYVLYMGRVGYNKGVDIAIEATAYTGQELVIAGQGSLEAMGYTTVPKHVKVVGYADQSTRRQLLANAQSLFIASRYSEPFGGVMAEAWLSGTPVISPDWGAFGEFNIQNKTGYKCRTFQHFVTALNDTRAGAIKSRDCREHAQQFTLDKIRPHYESYFSDILDVYTGRGWYEMGDQ